ncbi:hypothetical protein AB0D24_31965 [Streptomyces javensis]|uniref:effector-associated constant component EACC1 n=1 Tax=Streptomyces javensis TaxID=114698 RepID=UPI0033F244D0
MLQIKRFRAAPPDRAPDDAVLAQSGLSLPTRSPLPSRGQATRNRPHLRRWLARQPTLPGRVHRATGDAPPPGAMGTGTDAVLAPLKPGGVATVLAGAVVTWLQTRRGSRTVMRQADPLEGMVLPGGHLGPHRAPGAP